MLCGYGAVEDEEHLLVSCEIYADLRHRLYRRIKEETGWDWEAMQEEPRWALSASIGCGVGKKVERLKVRCTSWLPVLSGQRCGGVLSYCGKQSPAEELGIAFPVVR